MSAPPVATSVNEPPVLPRDPDRAPPVFVYVDGSHPGQPAAVCLWLPHPGGGGRNLTADEADLVAEHLRVHANAVRALTGDHDYTDGSRSVCADDCRACVGEGTLKDEVLAYVDKLVRHPGMVAPADVAHALRRIVR